MGLGVEVTPGQRIASAGIELPEPEPRIYQRFGLLLFFTWLLSWPVWIAGLVTLCIWARKQPLHTDSTMIVFVFLAFLAWVLLSSFVVVPCSRPAPPRLPLRQQKRWWWQVDWPSPKSDQQ